VPTTEIALYRDVIVAHNRHLTREVDDRANPGKVAAGSGFGSLERGKLGVNAASLMPYSPLRAYVVNLEPSRAIAGEPLSAVRMAKHRMTDWAASSIRISPKSRRPRCPQSASVRRAR
jgi:hypothetical protein